MALLVLTGDLVDSTQVTASAIDRAMQTLKQAMQDIASWSPLRQTGFARRGGDGWQMAFEERDTPVPALRAALYCQASLRRNGKLRPDDQQANPNITTRIAIAKGHGSLPETGDTNAAHGPAFVASGRLLDEMPRGVLILDAAGGARAAAALLADHIAQSWTTAQARALCEILPPRPGPRSSAAARLGITRQAVDQALHAAGFPALQAALKMLEKPTAPHM